MGLFYESLSRNLRIELALRFGIQTAQTQGTRKLQWQLKLHCSAEIPPRFEGIPILDFVSKTGNLVSMPWSLSTGRKIFTWEDGLYEVHSHYYKALCQDATKLSSINRERAIAIILWQFSVIHPMVQSKFIYCGHKSQSLKNGASD